MTSQNDSNFNSAMGIKQNFNVAENTTYQDKVDDIKIVAKLTGSDFEYWIHKDKVLVGRNSSNGKVDVNIESSSYVSRNHFQINHERGRFFLMCLGKNGVFVNGQFQRLGASPLPLDKACLIRFPSTSIRLKFDPHPLEVNHINGNSIQEESNVPILNNDQLKAPPTHLHVPTQLVHSKSISPNPIQANKDTKHEFSSPSIKYFISRDNRGFLSAPPSPTGTISAVNSCPSSPRSGTPHFVNPNIDVAENLKAAAIAASNLEKPDEKFSSAEGTDAKPPYSYAQLIIQAISSAPNRQLTLSGIYAHITKHYPYYRTADKGWQNSIRHNLSLNRYFVKVPRSQEESGKGSFWRVDPASERKLVEQAWRKRRQRAVPCFGSPLTSSLSNITRSAPVSPERSNPSSPASALRGVISSQDDYQASAISSDCDAKVQLVQFATRYAQSAPGSPAGLNHGLMVAPLGDRQPVSCHSSSQHRTTVITPASTLPLPEINSNKVMWSLHTINNQATSLSNTVTQTQVQPTLMKQERVTSNDTPTAIISTSKLSTIVPTPSSTSVNLSSIATFTPAQHRQFLQQAQSLPQQVVMMSGQPPQRLSQAIPINVGTLVANPGNMVNPGMPFVVPMNQQYIVKRVNEDSSSEPITKKAKTEADNASGESSVNDKASE